MSDAADPVARRISRDRWLLPAPAHVVLTLAASGPLLVVLIYSFLSPGDYGGIVWKPSLDGWFSVILRRDFFTDEPTFADAHLSIF